MSSDNRNVWFIVGLILVSLLAIYQPKFAGALVILVVVYLGFQTAKKGLV